MQHNSIMGQTPERAGATASAKASSLHVQVKEIMTHGAQVVAPDSTIQEVAQKMRGLNAGCMPVCDGNRIVGIVTELAIFYFSELAEIQAHAGREDEPSLREMLLDAGKRRTRAILMSAIAAILTLSPLALAIGRGSRMQQPLAIAIIFGMFAAVPLVLVVMPVLYSLAMRRRRSE